MRVGFVADLHTGNHRRFGGPVESGLNRRCRETVATLRAAVAKAKERNCSVIVILGDLFDTSHPEPQLIAAVQASLDIESVAIMGNHDQVSMMPGDHALGPLNPVATVVDSPRVLHLQDVELWAIPFRTGRAADWLPQVMAEVQGGSASQGSSASPRRILALHLGLSDGDTPPWLQDAHDSISAKTVGDLCAQYGIQHAFAGNWHDHKQWSFGRCLVTQVGTLCPTGWDNPGATSYGQLVIYDSKTGVVACETIPGPRFLKADPSNDGGLISQLALEGNKVYVRCDAQPELMDIAAKALEELKAAGTIVDGEIVPEGSEEQAAARTAAMAAKSADTLDEALAAFVKEMPLPESVDRAAVLARAKTYLGGA